MYFCWWTLQLFSLLKNRFAPIERLAFVFENLLLNYPFDYENMLQPRMLQRYNIYII
jgi:hypothetical protein